MKNILAAAVLLASCTAAPAQSFTFSGELEETVGMLDGGHFVRDLRPWSGNLVIDNSFATLSTTEGNWSGNAKVTRDTTGLITDLEASFISLYFDPVFGWTDLCYTVDLTGMTVVYDYYLNSVYGGTANLIAAVPEPETYVLVAAGIGLLLSRRKAKV